MKKKKTGVKILLVVLVALLAGGGLGAGYAFLRYLNRPESQESADDRIAKEPSGDEEQIKQPDTALVTPSPVTVRDVSAIVEYAMPSIVSIESEIVQTSRDYFFGRETEYSSVESGSGIIIGQNKTELLIVTNEHVISNARNISVTLIDNTVYNAELKGSDVNSDLAVLSVKLSDLGKSTKSQIRIATLGDSDQLTAGAMTIAIGNALGYGQSTTVGYVSATDRVVSLNDVERILIQTDAAINPGNSGGALLNANGQVIGINSIKYASEEVEGIGYAIPISDAIPIINELMNREELTEKEAGYLGIDGKTVTASYSLRFGIPVGIYIDAVVPGSPADEAGLKKGDIIVKVNGRSVSTEEDLQTILDYTRAGTTITVTVSTASGREYIEEDYQVTLSNR